MMKNPRKAQMFIVTTIFLVALIFSVQQLMFQYSFFDAPLYSSGDDYYIFNNIKDVINSTFLESHCGDINNNIDEIRNLLGAGSIAGGDHTEYERH